MHHKIEYEIELFPCCWEEIDPENLYDENHRTLASYGEVTEEQLEGTLWWTCDFTQPPRPVRIVKKQQ